MEGALLFGNAKDTGDVLPSPKPLPYGNYIVSTSAGGTSVFTQSCPYRAGERARRDTSDGYCTMFGAPFCCQK
jgi:hypothetical protein